MPFSQYRIVHHLSNVSLAARWLGRQLTSWVLAYFILSASVVDTLIFLLDPDRRICDPELRIRIREES
jgi:hypothetical protein